MGTLRSRYSAAATHLEQFPASAVAAGFIVAAGAADIIAIAEINALSRD